MMVTNRRCIDCGYNISNRGNRAIRCKSCQKKYRKRYKSKAWEKNKDRYKDRVKSRLGNPEQDDFILNFIRKKRLGLKTKKYKALPDYVFYTCNEAGDYNVG